MKMVWIAATAALLPGCLAVEATLHWPSLQTYYWRDGLVVRDDHRVFRYERPNNRSVLRIGKNLTFVDLQSDGRVDEIELGETLYKRGESGADSLFTDADRRWRETTEYLSTSFFKERWARMNPAEIVAWQEGARPLR